MNPVTSNPFLRGSEVYTKTSSLDSISLWSNAPPLTAFPIQQTPPPYDVTQELIH